MKRNVLVLATFDELGQGHGLYQAKILESVGMDVEFLCLARRNKETKNFFIDLTNPYSIKTLYYKSVIFFSKLLFFPHKDMRWFYKGEDWFVGYNEILKKTTKKPDYIVICQHVYFLSPKTIYQLWKGTGAEITMVMVDPRIVTGGCVFPFKCKGYLDGCENCNLYPYFKWIPQKIVAEKTKFLKPIPLRILGTSYDLKRTESIDFLKDKIKMTMVGMPIIDFVKTKEDARKQFNLNNDDFVLMAGATHTTLPIKGFNELLESLKIFSKEITSRKVKLLLLGKEFNDLDLPKNIEIITPGYLSFQDMFAAFYACDLFLSPSIEDSGPFMVNYAMACHRPVVGYKIGVALDLIINKETGWLAETQDVSDFAEGICFFYNLSNNEIRVIEEKCFEKIQSFQKSPWYEFMTNFNNK